MREMASGDLIVLSDLVTPGRCTLTVAISASIKEMSLRLNSQSIKLCAEWKDGFCGMMERAVWKPLTRARETFGRLEILSRCFDPQRKRVHR
jgi:hypothetical protein